MKSSSADNWFSKYVRIRDADSDGIIHCISCGRPVLWKHADAGHFVKRQHMTLRFNEKNVNAQCKRCNWPEQGNDTGYAKGLDRKYGPGTAEKLMILKNGSHHLGQFELKIIAKHYRNRFNELKKEKGL
jgi:hypothetical protein